MYVFMHEYMCRAVGAQGGQMRASNALEVEILVVVSHFL